MKFLTFLVAALPFALAAPAADASNDVARETCYEKCKKVFDDCLRKPSPNVSYCNYLQQQCDKNCKN